MDPIFEELCGVDSAQTFNFFSTGLREEVGDKKCRPDEMLYVASVLAHYAQTSCHETGPLAIPKSPVDFFDNFIFGGHVNDPESLEIGGSQVILFAGFFRDQIARRHNVRWYDQIGQSFYEKASQRVKGVNKRELFGRLSESLPMWTITCRNMHRTFRDNRFLLKIN